MTVPTQCKLHAPATGAKPHLLPRHRSSSSTALDSFHTCSTRYSRWQAQPAPGALLGTGFAFDRTSRSPPIKSVLETAARSRGVAASISKHSVAASWETLTPQRLERGTDNDNDHSFSQFSAHKAPTCCVGQSAMALAPPCLENRNSLRAEIIIQGNAAQTSCHLGLYRCWKRRCGLLRMSVS